MVNHSTTINHQDLFPTRIWFLNFPNHQTHQEYYLRRIESIKSRSGDGVRKSNRGGGWQSASSVLEEAGFEFLSEALKKIFSFCLNEMSPANNLDFELHGWANINLPGSYNLPHTHSPALLSAVYYLKVPEESGDIYFRDPRPGCSLSGFRGERGNCPPNCSADARVTPKEGLVLVFPAWLEHGVENHGGAGARISIAANAVLTSKSRNS